MIRLSTIPKRAILPHKFAKKRIALRSMFLFVHAPKLIDVTKPTAQNPNRVAAAESNDCNLDTPISFPWLPAPRSSWRPLGDRRKPEILRPRVIGWRGNDFPVLALLDHVR